ncbi:MAG: hypothetical protein Tsb005_11350 [Gammaproteobacteria bacterium]
MFLTKQQLIALLKRYRKLTEHGLTLTNYNYNLAKQLKLLLEYIKEYPNLTDELRLNDKLRDSVRNIERRLAKQLAHKSKSILGHRQTIKQRAQLLDTYRSQAEKYLTQLEQLAEPTSKQPEFTEEQQQAIKLLLIQQTLVIKHFIDELTALRQEEIQLKQQISDYNHLMAELGKQSPELIKHKLTPASQPENLAPNLQEIQAQINEQIVELSHEREAIREAINEFIAEENAILETIYQDKPELELAMEDMRKHLEQTYQEKFSVTHSFDEERKYHLVPKELKDINEVLREMADAFNPDPLLHPRLTPSRHIDNSNLSE